MLHFGYPLYDDILHFIELRILTLLLLLRFFAPAISPHMYRRYKQISMTRVDGLYVAHLINSKISRICHIVPTVLTIEVWDGKSALIEQ